VLPYGKQSVSDADVAAVTHVMQSDWLTTGPTVACFEAAVSAAAGGHPAVSCTSGTAALHIAYNALGLGRGDEVIVTPMTFVATASAASLWGAKLVFADTEDDTGLIDPAIVDALATSKTRVIAAVDYAGHPADYDALRQTAVRMDARILDDAAHSIGSVYRGRLVGELADITTFSFFPTKTVTTAEGGAVVALEQAVAERARMFHTIGMTRDSTQFRSPHDEGWYYEVRALGLNYRLNDMACALGLSQLARLRQFKARRAELTARYNEALSAVDGLRTPTQRPDVDPAWHLYPLRVLDGRRREVYDKMRAAGIGVQVNYIPVYWHPVYEDMGYKRGMCPRAEDFYAEELSLPLFPDLTGSQVDHVIDVLIGALK
jgi:dTDP-4-amino-4,6-dideoxygalactose transaminase